MRLPAAVWSIENPYRRMAWATLLLARYEVLEAGEAAADAARYLTGPEAHHLLDLLGVDREAFLSLACDIDAEEASCD